MEFDDYDNACDYINNVGIGNIVQVGMIIGISPWAGADKISYNYYIITRITNKFVVFKELNKSKKDVGAQYGGYQSVLFRLYKQRADKEKVKRVWGVKEKTKISIANLSVHNLIIQQRNKKYGFISLTQTYRGTEDWGR